MMVLLKLINFNKDIPLIQAGALPRISDGMRGEGCGQTRGRRGQIEQVEEGGSLARFCQSNLSLDSFEPDEKGKSGEWRDYRSSFWRDLRPQLFHLLD